MARARVCVAAGSAVATSSVSESKQGSLARITTHRLVERIDRGEITDATEQRPRMRTARRMLNTYKAKNGGRVSSSALSRAKQRYGTHQRVWRVSSDCSMRCRSICAARHSMGRVSVGARAARGQGKTGRRHMCPAWRLTLFFLNLKLTTTRLVEG